MAIWVCGDTHGEYDFSKLNTTNFPEQKSMNPEEPNYLIVCGDWGGLWDCAKSDRYVQSLYNERPWITLWVDGNHENFDALAQYKVEEWNGGKVQFISDHIIHLMRGQVYMLEGKRFFVMGGATSVDKYHRTEGKSWWAQEMPSNREYEEALTNLDRIGNKVDFIFTHTAPDGIIKLLSRYSWNNSDKLTQFLQIVSETVKFEDWYFGHFHIDKDMGRFHCMYNQKPRRIV